MRGISTWAVAVRKPSAEQLAAGGPDSKEGAKGEIEVVSEPLVSWTKRHRLLRVPVVRGVVALAESLKIGFRALGISANAQVPPDEDGEQKEIGGGAWVGHDRLRAAVRGRAVLPAAGRPDQPLLATTIPNGLVFVLIEKLDPHLDLPDLPVADLAHARPPARVRVPRRRAQDDLLLRGGRAAHAGERPALLALPPALRDQLPAAGDDRGDRRVRAARQARLAVAVRVARARASRSSPGWPSS